MSKKKQEKMEEARQVVDHVTNTTDIIKLSEDVSYEEMYSAAVLEITLLNKKIDKLKKKNKKLKKDSISMKKHKKILKRCVEQAYDAGVNGETYVGCEVY